MKVRAGGGGGKERERKGMNMSKLVVGGDNSIKDGNKMNNSIYLFRHVPIHCVQGNLY